MFKFVSCLMHTVVYIPAHRPVSIILTPNFFLNTITTASVSSYQHLEQISASDRTISLTNRSLSRRTLHCCGAQTSETGTERRQLLMLVLWQSRFGWPLPVKT